MDVTGRSAWRKVPCLVYHEKKSAGISYGEPLFMENYFSATRLLLISLCQTVSVQSKELSAVKICMECIFSGL